MFRLIIKVAVGKLLQLWKDVTYWILISLFPLGARQTCKAAHVFPQRAKTSRERVIVTRRGDCRRRTLSCPHISCCRTLAGDDMGKPRLKATSLQLPLEVPSFMLPSAATAQGQMSIRWLIVFWAKGARKQPGKGAFPRALRKPTGYWKEALGEDQHSSLRNQSLTGAADLHSLTERWRSSQDMHK